MKKKLPFVLSFALAALIVIGQASFAKGGSDDSGNNMMNMMNGNGMMTMMDNGTMNKMMSMMNSPAGKKMMSECQNVMTQYNNEK